MGSEYFKFFIIIETYAKHQRLRRAHRTVVQEGKLAAIVYRHDVQNRQSYHQPLQCPQPQEVQGYKKIEFQYRQNP